MDESRGVKEDVKFEIRFYEGIVKRSPRFIDALLPLAELYTRAGLYEKGLEADRRLARLCPDDCGILYNLACSLALTGHKSEALETLEQAVNLGYDDWEHMKKDADLKSLREEGVFQALVNRLQGRFSRD